MAVASAALSSSLFSTNDDGAWEEVILFSCTRDQTRVCHLLNHLTAFNDVLWNVGLQLRQVDEKKQLGNLVLATVPGMCDDFPLCSWCAVNEEQPVSFLNCLLRVHRCIVSAEMNIGVANSAMVIRALASSSSLRRLTVRGTELRDEQDPRIITLSQVPVGGLVSGYVYPGNIWAAPVVPCLLQQDSNATLTSLDVAHLEMTPPGVSMLITTLMNNRTVTELAVGYDVFARSPERPCSVPFEQYLTQRNVPLRKLALKSFRPFGDTSRLCFLAQAISSMTTLEELYARWPSRQIPCEIFAKMVLQSNSLQSVSLLLQNVDNAIVDLTHFECEWPRLRSWCRALLQNNVLLNLDLDVSWCSTNHCICLVKALAQNPARHLTLSLRNLPGDGCLEAVCEAIREGFLGHRVCIRHHEIDFTNTSVVPRFREVTTVTVTTAFLFENERVLRNVFETLPTCHHVTSLRLLLDLGDSATFDSLATYLRGAISLKEVILRIETDFWHYFDDVEGGDIDESVTAALQCLYTALCSNVNINKLDLSTDVRLSDDNCRMLAEYATLNNPHLYELSLRNVRSPRHFSRRLVPPFRRNYSLLLLNVPICVMRDPDMFGAQDVVRRNCGLVERATRFVMGERDRYGASALEFVSEHAKLVENVRLEAALPGDDEARDKIADALALLRGMDLNEFMRMTGVVQRQVICDYGETDARTQLDKLPFYDWTHIRQYLKLTDVVVDGHLV